MPLEVDVTARNDVSVGERCFDRVARGVREDHVFVRHRRRVTTDQTPACEIELDGRLVRRQASGLLSPPTDREQPRKSVFIKLLRPWIERQEELIGIAEDASPTELAEPVDGLDRLRTTLRDVPEANDLVEFVAHDLRDHRVEADGVAVQVGHERDAHASAVLPGG